MLAFDYFRGEKNIHIESLFGLAFIGLFAQHQPLLFDHQLVVCSVASLTSHQSTS